MQVFNSTRNVNKSRLHTSTKLECLVWLALPVIQNYKKPCKVNSWSWSLNWYAYGSNILPQPCLVTVELLTISLKLPYVQVCSLSFRPSPVNTYITLQHLINRGLITLVYYYHYYLQYINIISSNKINEKRNISTTLVSQNDGLKVKIRL